MTPMISQYKHVGPGRPLDVEWIPRIPPKIDTQNSAIRQNSGVRGYPPAKHNASWLTDQSVFSSHRTPFRKFSRPPVSQGLENLTRAAVDIVPEIHQPSSAVHIVQQRLTLYNCKFTNQAPRHLVRRRDIWRDALARRDVLFLCDNTCA